MKQMVLRFLSDTELREQACCLLLCIADWGATSQENTHFMPGPDDMTDPSEVDEVGCYAMEALTEVCAERGLDTDMANYEEYLEAAARIRPDHWENRHHE